MGSAKNLIPVILMSAKTPSPVIPRSAEGVTWGPSLLSAKLILIFKKIRRKFKQISLLYAGSPRPPTGGLGMTGLGVSAFLGMTKSNRAFLGMTGSNKAFLGMTGV